MDERVAKRVKVTPADSVFISEDYLSELNRIITAKRKPTTGRPSWRGQQYRESERRQHYEDSLIHPMLPLPYCGYNEEPRRYKAMIESYTDPSIILTRHEHHFHKECHACVSFDSTECKLCAACRHLRLRHLLLCNSDWESIYLNSHGKMMEQREACTLCNLVSTAGLRQLKYLGLLEPEKLNVGYFVRAAHVIDHLERHFLLEIVSSTPQPGRIHDRIGDARIILDVLFQDMEMQLPVVRSCNKIEHIQETLDCEQRSIHISHMAPGQTQVKNYECDMEGTRSSDGMHGHHIHSRGDEDTQALGCSSTDTDHEGAQQTLKPKLQRFEPSKLIHPLLNWETMTEWLGHCRNENHDTCLSVSRSNDIPTRLVDVESRRIVNATQDDRYFALSYVWGCPGDQQLQTTTSNLRELEKIGALAPHMLSTTIEDAILVCKNLKVRYLWVDSLCIIQDDAESKIHEIKYMDNIYASAELTIVAASGASGASGIPGVRSERHQTQSQAFFEGIEVVEILPNLSESVDRTLWNKRAWTYQERLLSKRCLYFTEDQVIFRCQQDILYEDRFVAKCTSILEKLWRLPTMSTYTLESNNFEYNYLVEGHPDRICFQKYAECLKEYTSRSLSVQSDILNAFTGVTRALSSLFKEEFTFGLPIQSFESAMLWKPCDDSWGRISESGMASPSWSWISLIGKVKYHEEAYSSGSLIEWNICHQGSRQFVSLQTKTRWMIPNGRKHLISRSIYGDFPLNNRIRPSKPVAKLMHGVGTWHIKVKPKAVQKKLLSNEYLKTAYKRHAKPGRLLFQSQTATFKLDRCPEFDILVPWVDVPKSSRILCLCNNTDTICGGMVMPMTWTDANLNPIAGQERLFEFVALSAALMPSRWKKFPGGKWSDLGKEQPRSEKDIGGLRYYQVPILNVMLIERSQEIAHRVGIGWVYLANWKMAHPQLKTIILE